MVSICRVDVINLESVYLPSIHSLVSPSFVQPFNLTVVNADPSDTTLDFLMAVRLGDCELLHFNFRLGKLF